MALLELARNLDPAVPLWVACLVFGCFLAAFTVGAVIDWRHMIIPDWINLPCLAAAMIAVPVLFENPKAHYLWGALTAVFFYGIACVRIRGQIGFGMGDVKLYTTVGLLLGPGVLSVLVAASLIGIVHSLVLARGQWAAMKDRKVPHGPHIVAGFAIVAAIGLLT